MAGGSFPNALRGAVVLAVPVIAVGLFGIEALTAPRDARPAAAAAPAEDAVVASAGAAPAAPEQASEVVDVDMWVETAAKRVAPRVILPLSSRTAPPAPASRVSLFTIHQTVKRVSVHRR